MNLLYAVGSNSGSVRNGLRIVEIDEASGRFRETGSVPDAAFPIYLARSADRPLLYAAELLPDGQGGVSTYAVEPCVPGSASRVSLRRVQSLPCAPTVPCHLSLSPDGRFLVWAEYRNAWTGVFAVGGDGLLRGPVAKCHHEGRGPHPVRQEAAHCHFAAVTRGNDEMFVCDLGTDTVAAYRLSPDGALAREPEHDLHVAPGSGPRHLAFHPNGRWVYLVNELASTVLPLRLEGRALVPLSAPLPMLPPGWGVDGGPGTVPTKAAAIRVSPDGTRLVASNRGHDSLAVFAIDPATGLLSPLSLQPLAGRFPRDFVFLPDGRHLLVAHKLCHEFATYAFDAATGALRLVQRSAKLTQPLAFERL